MLPKLVISGKIAAALLFSARESFYVHGIVCTVVVYYQNTAGGGGVWGEMPA
jgi:hypothetical protein